MVLGSKGTDSIGIIREPGSGGKTKDTNTSPMGHPKVVLKPNGSVLFI